MLTDGWLVAIALLIHSLQWVMNTGDDSGSAAAEEDDDGVHFAELVNLEVMIEKVSASTNEYLIRRLNENYHLLDHCRALKSYLLLGQVRREDYSRDNTVDAVGPGKDARQLTCRSFLMPRRATSFST